MEIFFIFYFETFLREILKPKLIGHIYIYIIQVTPHVTLNNVTPSNNLLLNSYFNNPTIELHVLYMLNIHANFHANRILFTL